MKSMEIPAIRIIRVAMAKAMKAMEAFKAMNAAAAPDAPKAMKAKPWKSPWPGWEPVSVGGGMEQIWARPVRVLYCGYGGAMFRLKVRKNSSNKWVKVAEKDKEDKKVKKDNKDKKVNNAKN